MSYDLDNIQELEVAIEGLFNKFKNKPSGATKNVDTPVSKITEGINGTISTIDAIISKVDQLTDEANNGYANAKEVFSKYGKNVCLPNGFYNHTAKHIKSVVPLVNEANKASVVVFKSISNNGFSENDANKIRDIAEKLQASCESYDDEWFNTYPGGKKNEGEKAVPINMGFVDAQYKLVTGGLNAIKKSLTSMQNTCKNLLGKVDEAFANNASSAGMIQAVKQFLDSYHTILWIFDNRTLYEFTNIAGISNNLGAHFKAKDVNKAKIHFNGPGNLEVIDA